MYFNMINISFSKFSISVEMYIIRELWYKHMLTGSIFNIVIHYQFLHGLCTPFYIMDVNIILQNSYN